MASRPPEGRGTSGIMRRCVRSPRSIFETSSRRISPSISSTSAIRNPRGCPSPLRATAPASTRTGARSSKTRPASSGPSSRTARWPVAPSASFATTSARWGIASDDSTGAEASRRRRYVYCSPRSLSARYMRRSPTTTLHPLRVLEKCGFRRIGVERDDEATMHVLRIDRGETADRVAARRLRRFASPVTPHYCLARPMKIKGGRAVFGWNLR